MKVNNLQILEEQNHVRISASVESVHFNGGRTDLWFRMPKPFDKDCLNIGDPFLGALLVPAMMVKEDLEIQLPTSSVLLRNADEIQSIFFDWHRSLLKKINIITQSPIAGLQDTKESSLTAKSASYFSGGVDSWHTFLKNRDKIQGVIMVNGFDIPTKDRAAWNVASTNFQNVVTIMRVRGHIVETNVREIIDPKVGGFHCAYEGDAWGMLLHGGCLAAVGLLMQGHYHEIFIPSTYSYRQLHPWASHPLIDEKWSTESLRFVHDSCGESRMDKIKYIAANQEALNHLRVCWTHSQGYLNCCRCEKCSYTMLALKVIGKLDASKAFHLPFDKRCLVREGLNEEWGVLLYEDILDEARKQKNDEMIQYVEVLLGRRFSASKLLADTKRIMLKYPITRHLLVGAHKLRTRFQP